MTAQMLALFRRSAVQAHAVRVTEQADTGDAASTSRIHEARYPAGLQPAARAPAVALGVVRTGQRTDGIHRAVGRAAINRCRQVAYGIDRSGFFYDGSRIIQIPGIAGSSLVAPINLNDKGQVVGAAAVGDNNGSIHAFVRSKKTGTRELLPLEHASTAEARSIDNYGMAAGDSPQDPAGSLPGNAVLWKPANRRYDLGTLGKGLSFAETINDAGPAGLNIAPNNSLNYKRSFHMEDLCRTIPCNA